MQVKITLTATIDIDELESTLDYIDYDEDSLELECDHVDTIYGNTIAEKIEYLELCDSIGETYEKYCDYHEQYYSETEYNDNYIGTYRNITKYAIEYTQGSINLDSLPDIITNNIDYTGIAEDLTSDLTVIDLGCEVAIYRY